MRVARPGPARHRHHDDGADAAREGHEWQKQKGGRQISATSSGAGIQRARLGSDLASLKTRGELRGDEVGDNGKDLDRSAKTADFMFCGTTEPDGSSTPALIMIDMKSRHRVRRSNR